MALGLRLLAELGLAIVLAVLGAAQADEVSDHLASDDECAASGQTACAVNALQARTAARHAAGLEAEQGEDQQARKWWWDSCEHIGCFGDYQRYRPCQCTEDCGKYGNCCKDFAPVCHQPDTPPSDDQGEGRCIDFGCFGHYQRHRPCQCTRNCARYGNCCTDFNATCYPAPSTTSPEPTLAPASAASPYKKVWAAQGPSFFEQFEFKWRDNNHGSPEYLLQAEAEAAGVVEAHRTHAILRAGKASPRFEFKRETAKIATKETWNHFLATMQYSHVPFGCGVWPAFFTLAPDYPWPQGGEMDILEYVNADFSKSSLHTAKGCKLSSEAVQRVGAFPDRNDMDYDCETGYPDLLGCAPNKWMKTGKDWALNPGVVAMEWTADFVKIFYIPDNEIPEDLRSETPRPEQWERWLFSYYPLKESGCQPNVIQPQQMVLQISFCGDWASKVWDADKECKAMISGCRAVDPLAEYAPEEDCCTQFIWDAQGEHSTDEYLQDRAFFNISYLKVFQQEE